MMHARSIAMAAEAIIEIDEMRVAIEIGKELERAEAKMTGANTSARSEMTVVIRTAALSGMSATRAALQMTARWKRTRGKKADERKAKTGETGTNATTVLMIVQRGIARRLAARSLTALEKKTRQARRARMALGMSRIQGLQLQPKLQSSLRGCRSLQSLSRKRPRQRPKGRRSRSWLHGPRLLRSGRRRCLRHPPSPSLPPRGERTSR